MRDLTIDIFFLKTEAHTFETKDLRILCMDKVLPPDIPKADGKSKCSEEILTVVAPLTPVCFSHTLTLLLDSAKWWYFLISPSMNYSITVKQICGCPTHPCQLPPYFTLLESGNQWDFLKSVYFFTTLLWTSLVMKLFSGVLYPKNWAHCSPLRPWSFKALVKKASSDSQEESLCFGPW